MTVKVKLCGFTSKEAVNFAVSCGAGFIGFVFYDSSVRNISPAKAGEISSQIDSKAKKVAVVVDPNDEKILTIISHLKPDFLQLHGNETLARVIEIKNRFAVKIIKSFAIADVADLSLVNDYQDVADLFLFDAKASGYGGSGKNFDWNILRNLELKKDWFLSGGINIGNVDQALRITNAKMIDLSSGIEEKRGVKSLALIEDIMKKINLGSGSS